MMSHLARVSRGLTGARGDHVKRIVVAAEASKRAAESW